uniref:Uncharacterized protein n=1 Tax=Percolomonas cosmopolitus TaxID=63605 RepID=A0A7S1KKZ2_9EUKA|mmetsp:Transcript_10306/g.38262  ORF Transcript_10306/g.38262 Transcript_10306/m.38262 type:complete len:1321 (+) Transcript_10306:262-4224(+)|eukprot:CAMPEP_0117438342 /NCGR_PEP_ID=MMETSP0759-20121206/2004_1 /TAXON_ID=63605 /ORGANISM="Percolomonas cosmopolitus, Strain WS" /LENGTH=1320 /DNA_ID=CAMNT_0005230031 /DNA_START=222 /DNA_END=4184 /DNA_ORIENTATION=-
MTKRSRSEYDDELENNRERKKARKSFLSSVVDKVFNIFSPRKEAPRSTLSSSERTPDFPPSQQAYLNLSPGTEGEFGGAPSNERQSSSLVLSHRKAQQARRSPVSSDVVLPSARRPQYSQQPLYTHQVTPADVIKTIAPSMGRRHDSIYPTQKLFDTSETNFGSAFSHVVHKRPQSYFAPYSAQTAAEGYPQIGFDPSKPLFTLNKNMSTRAIQSESQRSKTPLFSATDYSPNRVEKVTPRNLDAYIANPTYTDTAKRIMETLDQLSTPLMDLRRMRPKSLNIKLRTGPKKRLISETEFDSADGQEKPSSVTTHGSLRKRPRTRSPSPPSESLNISTFTIPKAIPTTKSIFTSPEDERRPKDSSTFSKANDAEIVRSPFSKTRIPKKAPRAAQEPAPKRFENHRVRSNLRTRRTPYGIAGGAMEEEEEEDFTFEEVTREKDQELKKMKPLQLEKPLVLADAVSSPPQEAEFSPVQVETPLASKSTGFTFDKSASAKKANTADMKTAIQAASAFNFSANTEAQKKEAPTFSFGDNFAFSSHDKAKRKREESLSPVKEVTAQSIKKIATEEPVAAFRFDVDRAKSPEKEEQLQQSPSSQDEQPTNGSSFSLEKKNSEVKSAASSGGFTFGGESTKQSFSFGDHSEEKKIEEVTKEADKKPVSEEKKTTAPVDKPSGEGFTFGGTPQEGKKKEIPAAEGGFRFDPTSANGFSFGDQGTKKASDEKEAPPASSSFTFGEKATTKTKEESSSGGFTFTTAPSAEKKKDTEEKKDTNFGFTFGETSTPEKKEDAKESFSGFQFNTKPSNAGGFSFGDESASAKSDTTEKKESEAPKPSTSGFSFGDEKKDTTATSTGDFAIGVSTTSEEKNAASADQKKDKTPEKPSSSSTSFGFDLNKNDAGGSFFNSAPKTTTTEEAKKPSASGFSFGDVSQQDSFPVGTFEAPKTKTPEKKTEAPSTTGFAFGNSAASSESTLPKPAENKTEAPLTSAFTFGASATATKPSTETKPSLGDTAKSDGGFTFGDKQSTSETKSSPGFGGFGGSGGFGATTTSEKPPASTGAFAFGASATSATTPANANPFNPFGAPATSTPGTSSNTSGFGAFPSGDATKEKSASGFGGFNSGAGFGASSSEKPASSSGGFSGFNANSFGASASTGQAASPNPLGASAPTSANPFGGNSTFGVSQQPSQSTTSSANPFGSSSGAFGASTNNGGSFTFGANSNAAQSGSTNSGFGAAPNSAGSGFSANSGGFGAAPSSASSGFSANSGGFGAGAAAPAFGAPANIPFGGGQPAGGAFGFAGGTNQPPNLDHTSGRRILKARRKKRK